MIWHFSNGIFFLGDKTFVSVCARSFIFIVDAKEDDMSMGPIVFAAAVGRIDDWFRVPVENEAEEEGETRQHQKTENK